MRRTAAFAALALVTGGCGATTLDRASEVPISTLAPPQSIAPVTTAPAEPRTALVRIDGRLAALAPTALEPAWVLDGAVAAADGASAYRVEAGELVRFDTATGSAAGRWPLPPGTNWRVAVVSGIGAHVVLTDGVIDSEHRPATSRLVLWHALTPDAPKLVESPGALEPEAISPDGTRVYVLDHRDGYYRVRNLELSLGQLFDTFGRDKSPAEDMAGHAVHATLSPDGRMLSTLYRAAHGDHEPFVHVLHLEYGWSYCADLPAGSYTSIASSVDGRTVYVGASDGSWIDLAVATLETTIDPLPVQVHRGSEPPVPLNAAGTLVTPGGIVTADSRGVAWYRNGQLINRVDHPVERLVALVSS